MKKMRLAKIFMLFLGLTYLLAVVSPAFATVNDSATDEISDAVGTRISNTGDPSLFHPHCVDTPQGDVNAPAHHNAGSNANIVDHGSCP